MTPRKPAVFAEEQRRFAVLRKRLAARAHGGGDLRRGGNVGETAAAERLPVPHGGQPAAGERTEVRDLIRGQAVGLRPGEDRAGERMLALLLERKRRAKQLCFAYTVCGKKLGDLRLAAVMVPVLSSATMSTRPDSSSDVAVLKRMPFFAPSPLPTMMATGVASPSAQGQLMTSTEMPRARAKPTL